MWAVLNRLLQAGLLVGAIALSYRLSLLLQADKAFTQGKYLVEAGQPAQAVQYLDDATRLHPFDGTYLYMYGVAFMQMHSSKYVRAFEANRTRNRMLVLFPESERFAPAAPPPVPREITLAHDLFTRARRLSQVKAIVYYDALLKDLTGDLESAICDLEKVRVLSSDDDNERIYLQRTADVFMALATRQVTEGRTADALASAIEAVRIQPGRAVAREVLGAVHFLHGSIADAQRELAESLRLRPEGYLANVLMARVLMQMQTPAEAAIHLERCLESPLIRDSIAVERLRVAAQEYLQVTRTSQGFYIAGRIALHSGNFDEAERFLREALRLAPDFPAASYELARVFFQQGKTEQMMDLLNQTVRGNPHHLEALRMLATALNRQ